MNRQYSTRHLNCNGKHPLQRSTWNIFLFEPLYSNVPRGTRITPSDAEHSNNYARETMQCFTWNKLDQRTVKSEPNTYIFNEITTFVLQKQKYTRFAAKQNLFEQIDSRQLQKQLFGIHSPARINIQFENAPKKKRGIGIRLKKSSIE
jgi:hypothetical protein